MHPTYLVILQSFAYPNYQQLKKLQFMQILDLFVKKLEWFPRLSKAYL
jgi:hypothetical protein